MANITTDLFPDDNTSEQVILVATPSPLRFPLSYRLPSQPLGHALLAGMRVKVALGSRQVIGVVIANQLTADTHQARLKPILELLDAEPLLDQSLIELLNWAVSYYQHPIGQVYQYIFPSWLRQGKPAEQTQMESWQLSSIGMDNDTSELSRSSKQIQLIMALRNSGGAGLSVDFLNSAYSPWRDSMKRLQSKGWVSKQMQKPIATLGRPQSADFEISAQQQQSIDAIGANLSSFQVHLLQGVTGSGKTEVYLRLARQVIEAGQQVLVLIPEIGLSPQMLQRFQQRLAANVVLLHSGLSEKQRLNNWLAAQQGDADIVVGTRSAVFTPLPRLGLIVVDEEHDVSFKQQEGFRYFGRDVAIKRAQLLSIPILLGSATPSLESLQNAWSGKYQFHQLTERVGSAASPPVPSLIDLRGQGLQDGLSNKLLATMREHLARGDQVLLFLNRRGFAPTLLCHECGWIARCDRCDSHMTLYRGVTRQRCHHCGSERKAPSDCPECQSPGLIALGEGTERVEQVLQDLFTEVDVLRIDRDSMRKKEALSQAFEKIHQGEPMILLGTQMLAKGHHFPDVTLVGILNIDQGLFSTDFRALERMAQLIVQVSGRAGRAKKPGQVMLQTHYPEHPLLLLLLSQGYSVFAKRSLEERELAAMPPFHYLCLLRAESPIEQKALEFLRQARVLGENLAQGIQLLGPMPAPMLKRAGRYRAQLLIHASDRQMRQQFLHHWVQLLDKCQLRNTVRWSLDVDPMDMF